MPASRAYSSSSGEAACPRATRGQSRGRPRESGGDSKAIYAKKNFVTDEGRTKDEGWTDRRVGRNSDVD